MHVINCEMSEASVGFTQTDQAVLRRANFKGGSFNAVLRHSKTEVLDRGGTIGHQQ